MRRLLPVLAVAACAGAPAAATAADTTGYFAQLPGPGGCITFDGKSFGSAADCVAGRGMGSANAIALTPEGRFAYVHTYNGNVIVLSRDTTTGALSELDDPSACFSHDGSSGACTDVNGTGSDSDSGHAIAVVGSHIYTAGRDAGMVDRFDRSTVTGALTEADCLSADGNDADLNATCTKVDSLVGAQSLAVSPDGKFLYAGSYTPDGPYGLSVLSIGTNGELAPVACYVAVATTGCTVQRLAANFYDVAMSPDGKTLYATSYEGDVVVAFARDATTGELTQIAGTGGCVINTGVSQPTDPCTVGHGLDGSQSVEVSPDGKFVSVGAYTANGVVVLKRAGDGTLSQADGAASCLNETGADGCGTARESQSVYTTVWGPDSGLLVAAANGRGAGQGGLAFFDVAPDGTITQRPGTRGCSSDTGIDSGGVPDSCAKARGIDAPPGLAITADGRWLYAASYGDGGVAGFRLEHPPVCGDASASTAFGTPTAIPLSCTDADGDALTAAVVGGPGHGSVTVAGLSASYAPAAGFSGADSFTFKASDGIADSAPATATVSVAAGSPPPSGKQTPAKLSLGAKPKRDRKLPFRFVFSGKLTPAAGTTCSGKVVVTVKRGSKTVAKRTATLASSCTWTATVTFKNRRKLGKTPSGKLTATARFGGNAALNAKSSKALTVRFG
jgi:hypothetical protein